MKVAALQYKYHFPQSFDCYKKQIADIVQSYANQRVDLLVFPEYAGMDMLAFTDIEGICKDLPFYEDLFQELSNQHQMMICSGTIVVHDKGKMFNRSYLFCPNQKATYQDKCMTTPYEVDEGIISRGNFLHTHETSFGKIGICICYDVEFPSFVKAHIDGGAKVIIVPSYTSTLHGFYRVFLSCRARAIENQCYVIQSAQIGQTDIEMTYGAAAICAPVDEPFPEDGLLAMGFMNQEGAAIADLDFSLIEQVRAFGQTRNFLDGQNLIGFNKG